MMDDPKTKMEFETPYELLKYDQKKQLSKNNEAKTTLYNALPFKDCKIDLLTQQYEKFSVSSEVPIDSGFTRFNVIAIKPRSAIEEAKDLARLLLDELIGNLKVYEMILENDGVAFKTTKEKVWSLALKAKVTKEQTSDDSDNQGGSDKDEDLDEDEAEAEAFN
ncbi:hypothetical protein Tco_0163057 [Tanacetum coccineum]